MAGGQAVYEQKKLSRWLESYLEQQKQQQQQQQRRQRGLSPLHSLAKESMPEIHSHHARHRIVDTGSLVKVVQMTRGIWSRLDKEIFETMGQVFSQLEVLELMDECELGNVLMDEYYGFHEDPLDLIAVGKYLDDDNPSDTTTTTYDNISGDDDETEQMISMFESLGLDQELMEVHVSLEELARWFPRLQSLVLPRGGLTIPPSGAPARQRRKRTRTAIDMASMDQGDEDVYRCDDWASGNWSIKRVKHGLQECSSQMQQQQLEPRRLAPHLVDLLPLAEHLDDSRRNDTRFWCLTHVSCWFEARDLLRLDQIVNEMSMPCLTEVEIRTCPSRSAFAFDGGPSFKDDTEGYWRQNMALTRRVLGRTCVRDLKKIFLPSIMEEEEIGSEDEGESDSESDVGQPVPVVQEIKMRHARTLECLSLCFDGLSRELSLPPSRLSSSPSAGHDMA